MPPVLLSWVQPAEEHAGPARLGSLRVCPEDKVGADFKRGQPDELAPDSPKVDKTLKVEEDCPRQARVIRTGLNASATTEGQQEASRASLIDNLISSFVSEAGKPQRGRERGKPDRQPEI